MSKTRNAQLTGAKIAPIPNPQEIDRRSRLRSLPSVEELRQRVIAWYAARNQTTPAHATLTAAARMVIARARVTVQAGILDPIWETVVEETVAAVSERARPRLRAVINAGGAILNTNLGRAPLSERAIARIVEVAGGYSNLELDLDSGDRGSRQTHIRDLLRELVGAEDAIAVNNNAAATLLTLTALARDKEVVVSRGELVEIGGGFRIPDILAQSGAQMREIGTTNRARLSDYVDAITSETATILSVHPSNFRMTGFTAAPSLKALAALAHEHDIPFVRDLGSGALLDTANWGLAHEETIRETLLAGVDIVCFSGDKLLGGPQAGVIAGKRALIERIERHPLARAVRCDKLTLAALEATLRAYLEDSAVSEIPIWAAINAPLSALEKRAQAWADALTYRGIPARAIPGESVIGGGSLPGETLPTTLCAITLAPAAPGRDAESLAWRLRTGDPAVLPRIGHGQALLDPRAVLPSQDSILIEAVARAWETATRTPTSMRQTEPYESAEE